MTDQRPGEGRWKANEYRKVKRIMANNMMIYTTADGLTKVETTFEQDTVWLSLDQMAELFQRNKSTISRHIRKIYEEGELKRESVVAKFATTAADGKTYDVDYYSSPVLSEGVVLVFAALLSVYPLRLAIRTGDCQVDQRRADTGDARGKNKHDVQTEALEGNAAE